MKALTHAEKQQLGAKIKEETERQRVIRMNPNTPAAPPEVDFIFNNLYKYGMLAIILYLLVMTVRHLLKWHNFFAYDEYGPLLIVLALLFTHIAHNFTKTGWKNRVMRAVAWGLLVLGCVYIFWIA